MQGLPFVLLFTALTFLSWGAYGPLLRHGTDAMGHDGLKAFVGVGLAYFVIAVIVPFWILRQKGEKGRWTFVGTTYSIIAGSVGAIGALGIILALVFNGSPVYVMPLVFGFAPIVNTLVTAWMGGTLNKISPVFISGIVAAALGAGGVLYFKPPARPAQAATVPSESTPATPAELPTGDKPLEPATELQPEPTVTPSPQTPEPHALANQVVPEVPSTTTPTPATASPLAQPQPPPSVDPAPASAATDPVISSAPATDAPAPVAQPLLATLPVEGQAPAPETQPAAAQPPVAPPLSAVLPDYGSPPAPTIPAPPVVPTQVSPPAVAPPAIDLPPAVVNPELDTLSSQDKRVHLVMWRAGLGAAGAKPASPAESMDKPVRRPHYGMIALSILMAALCWGSYGPMLHQGQMRMGGSRLRPFACVGIAYFIIAVAAPLLLLNTNPTLSPGAWTGSGLGWSVVAGGAGALGALGIILAFNSGGKPIYVMPLVFGFAPVINTFISLTEAGTWPDVRPEFWVSLAVVIAGAITVLITAPKAHHGPAHAPAK